MWLPRKSVKVENSNSSNIVKSSMKDILSLKRSVVFEKSIREITGKEISVGQIDGVSTVWYA